MKQWIIEEAQREPVPDIGQVDPATKRALDKMVKRGEIAKWRGHWHPVAGAHFGIGPLKTCYGPKESRDYFAQWANADKSRAAAA